MSVIQPELALVTKSGRKVRLVFWYVEFPPFSLSWKK